MHWLRPLRFADAGGGLIVAIKVESAVSVLVHTQSALSLTIIPGSQHSPAWYLKCTQFIVLLDQAAGGTRSGPGGPAPAPEQSHILPTAPTLGESVWVKLIWGHGMWKVNFQNYKHFSKLFRYLILIRSIWTRSGIGSIHWVYNNVWSFRLK